MSAEEYLEIKEIGLPLKAADGSEFRKVFFQDIHNMKESDYVVFRKSNPYLWKTIEKFESGKYKKPFLQGYISNYNGIDIVVFQGEDPAEAFEKQKYKLKDEHKIGRKEAIRRIENSSGYITDISPENALVPYWVPLDKTAKMIKVRYYHSANRLKGNKTPYFDWSGWFQINN